MSALVRWASQVRAWYAAAAPLISVVPERRLAFVVAVAGLLWLVPGRVGNVAGVVGLSLVGVALIADVLWLPGRGSVTIVRRAPTSIGLGDDEGGTYTLTSHTSRHVKVIVADDLQAPLVGGIASRDTPLAAGAEQQLAFPLRANARGRFALGAIGARIRTPLGLVGRRVRLQPTDTVDVIPSVAGIGHYRLLALQHRLDLVGIRALRRKGEGFAFAGVREYARGDDPRRIHWKATARRDKLMVTEHTVERSQTLVLLIDAGRGMTQLSGNIPRFEHAVSSALLLTDVAANGGDRVGALVFNDAVRAWVPPRTGRSALPAIRDAVAPVTATVREPDYAGAFRFLALQQRRRALIVLFTDVIDPRASQALVAHVTRSAARHLAVVVALRNDAVVRAARPALHASASALYEAAAAEELLQGREQALATMRAAGVMVLDVSPAAMTPGLINTYLSIKARGAL